MMEAKKTAATTYANPYAAGVLLGLTLLASFLILGAGLGASGGLARFAAWLEHLVWSSHVEKSVYFGSWFPRPLDYYLTYMALGVILGGYFSAFNNGRTGIVIEKGAAAPIRLRVVFSVIGGVLVGFASRLAGGCTSGQALTGGALLLTGSLVFLVCLFAGGYAAAVFFRRQWHD